MVKPFDDALVRHEGGRDRWASGNAVRLSHHQARRDQGRSRGRNSKRVKPKIEEEVRKGKAGKRFAEAAESFSNIVYEQPDSLQAGQSISSSWRRRKVAGSLGKVVTPPLLNNEKFLRSLFSDEVLKNKRNTEAIEIAPNMLIAARVIEHEPASQRPFADVQAEIVRQLTQEKAVVLAKQDGEAKLANSGKAKLCSLLVARSERHAREAGRFASGRGAGCVRRRTRPNCLHTRVSKRRMGVT